MAFTLRKRTSVQYKTKVCYNVGLTAGYGASERGGQAEDHLDRFVDWAMKQADYVASVVAGLILQMRGSHSASAPQMEESDKAVH